MFNVPAPKLLALDFDGVLCDGLREYFQTTWRTYCQIWAPVEPSPELAAAFYRLRPVIEVGWEMTILLRALVQQVPEATIFQSWYSVSQQILSQEQLQASELGARLDQVRDEWIASDPESWLGLHQFYPGIPDRLRRLVETGTEPVIVTTKEGRFVHQLLQQSGLKFADRQVLGKENKKPKHQILRELIADYFEQPIQPEQVWFIEDRLKTLQSVQQQSDLEAVHLFLADWGYNTAIEREQAQQDPRLYTLSLETFTQEFDQWIGRK